MPSPFIQSRLHHLADELGGELCRDSDGQVILYTGLYENEDGSWRDTPEPACRAKLRLVKESDSAEEL